MTNLIIVRRVLNIIRDVVWACIYFRTSDMPRRKNIVLQLLGNIALMCLFFLYAAQDGGVFSSAWARLVWRIICCCSYMVLTRKLSFRLALFDSLTYVIVVILAHNVFLTPVTRPVLLMSVSIVENQELNHILCLLLPIIVTCIMYGIAQICMPLRIVQRVGTLEVLTMLVIAVCGVELNAFLRLVTDSAISVMPQISAIAVVLNLVMLACVIFVTQLQNKLRDNAQAQIRLARIETELNNAGYRKQYEEKLRELRHDTNNHLTTLRYLISVKNEEKALAYVDNFLEHLPQELPSVQTGNAILDGLLAEKLVKANAWNIETMIAGDLSKLNYLDDFDLCAIFGNALDNAIEACQKVMEASNRFLYLRCRQDAGQIIVTITNSVERSAAIDSSHFHTTKKDTENHGFGLKSMRKSIEKYGGVLLTKYKEEEACFKLIIMLPEQTR